MSPYLKKARHLSEAGLLLITMGFFKILPLDMASALGGSLARFIGPFLRAHRVADTNLTRVFPEYDDHTRRRILSGMWDNLGRVAGEYPHLSPETMRNRITIEGAEHVEAFKAGKGKGAVFVSGHFANWELCPLASVIFGVPATFIYREANNPYAEKLIQSMRRGYCERMFGKGRESAQKALQALKGGGSLALLADQKLNEGTEIPFMGFNAKTTLSAAKLALKFHVPVIAMHVVRTDGAHFHVTINPPKYYAPGTLPTDIMNDVHQWFERWIREHPEQWFWVHNRWSWKLPKK